MDEARAIKLSGFRVGEDKPMGKDMTAEEVALRKQFIKTMLWKVKPWNELKDEQLDDVRIFKSGTDWYIEDRDYYEYPF